MSFSSVIPNIILLKLRRYYTSLERKKIVILNLSRTSSGSPYVDIVFHHKEKTIDFPASRLVFLTRVSGANLGFKGNLVKVEDGPAAVTEDRTHIHPLESRSGKERGMSDSEVRRPA